VTLDFLGLIRSAGFWVAARVPSAPPKLEPTFPNIAGFPGSFKLSFSTTSSTLDSSYTIYPLLIAAACAFAIALISLSTSLCFYEITSIRSFFIIPTSAFNPSCFSLSTSIYPQISFLVFEIVSFTLLAVAAVLPSQEFYDPFSYSAIIMKSR